jgi:hypothetical protein
LCVALFCGSWDGSTSREVERGSGARNVVDCKFLCSMRRGGKVSFFFASSGGIFEMFGDQGFAESGPRGEVAASYGGKECGDGWAENAAV